MNQINAAGRELLKHYEQGPKGGPALRSYLCPAGKWTLGWGCTDNVGPGMTVSRAGAEQLLDEAIAKRTRQLDRLLWECPTSSNQFSAMLLLLFNIGADNFAHSRVLARHKLKDYAGAARSFGLWNKAHVDGHLVVLAGLVKRRADEAALYARKDPT